MPNFAVHSQADEKRSDRFLPFLAEHATGAKEAAAVRAARDSLAFNAMYRKGIAPAQKKFPCEIADGRDRFIFGDRMRYGCQSARIPQLNMSEGQNLKERRHPGVRFQSLF